MPQILKPSDVMAWLKAGQTPRDIFFDASGARTAKLVGVEASVTAGIDDRSADFVISTGALDRYNSTISVEGWKTENFEKNPVVLWAHDDTIPAIGRAENVRVEDGRLKSRAVFAERDAHPLADTIFQLIKARFIGAASVGWIPLEYKFVEGGERGFGIDYLAQELLEWSVVNIPANPDCLVGARSLGIDTSPLIAWAERALDQGGMTIIPRAEIEALRKAAGSPVVYEVPPFLPSRSAGGRQQFPPAANGGKHRGEDKSFEQSAAALNTLFVNGVLSAEEFAGRLIVLARGFTTKKKRAGRVLSEENERRLRAAHDHCMAAGDHVMGVIEQNHKPDSDDGDGDDNGTDEDPEQATLAAPESEIRARRVRLLRLAKPS
jgi:HK97 family phage prohead protease